MHVMPITGQSSVTDRTSCLRFPCIPCIGAMHYMACPSAYGPDILLLRPATMRLHESARDWGRERVAT